MKKRIISMLSALVMTASVFPGGTARAAEPEKVFDLQIAADGTARDAQSGIAAEVHKAGDKNYSVIEKSAIYNNSGAVNTLKIINTTGKKYDDQQPLSPENARSWVAAESEKFAGDEITVELWAKIAAPPVDKIGESDGWRGTFLNLAAYSGTAHLANQSISVSTAKKQLKNNLTGREFYQQYTGSGDKDEVNKSTTAWNNEWAQIVITKKYENGKFTYMYYINSPKGRYKGKDEYACAAYTNETKGRLFIGTAVTQSNSVRNASVSELELGTVRVYRGILSEDDVDALYARDKDRYSSVLTDDISLFNTELYDKNGEKLASASGTANVTLKTTAVSKIDTPTDLYAAIYDGEKMLDVKKYCVSAGSTDITAEFNNIAAENGYIKVFAWDSGFKPVIQNKILGETAWTPLATDITFADANGQKITSLENCGTMAAKVILSGSRPGTNIKVQADITKNGETSRVCDDAVKFDSERIAEKTVDFDVSELGVNDTVTVNILADGKIFMSKKIGYEDLSKTVDVLLIAGQSNALGQYADKTQSIKPDKGTVYYNTMGNETLSETGVEGWAGALGKTWHERTGHTVLIVKAAYGGTGFADNEYGLWGPNNKNNGADTSTGRDCYSCAKKLYNKGIDSVRDAAGYELGDHVYFWLQGENENGKETEGSGYTAAQYAQAFSEMHNGFMTEFGDAQSRIMCGGILPVRSSSAVTFPDNLHLTGPRIAQYYLASTRDDLCIVSSATENWYSDSSIKSWFENKYKNIGYDMGDMPTAAADIFRGDNVHYNQKAHNEMGFEAAENMLAYLNRENSADSLGIITPCGIKHYQNGAEIYLEDDKVIPTVMSNQNEEVKLEIISGTNVKLNEWGVMECYPAKKSDYSTLKVTVGDREMQFKIHTTAMSIDAEIAPIKDNKKAIYTFVTDDGVYDSVVWYDSEFRKNNLRGSVAFVTDWVGTKEKCGTWDKWRELINSGDSVFTAANHSKSHVHLTSLGESELNGQINGARETIRKNLPGQKVLGLALPFNAVSTDVRAKAKEQHGSMRGSGSGYNDIPISGETLYNTKFQLIINTLSADDMNGWVDNAINNNKWLMELWHGIEASDKYTTTKEKAANHFAYIGNRSDDIWVADWDEVTAYSTQRLNSKIELVDYTDSTLTINVVNELDKTLYDEDVTLNVKLPEGWTSATAEQNGSQLASSVSGGVISFNYRADGGYCTITKTP